MNVYRFFLFFIIGSSFASSLLGQSLALPLFSDNTLAGNYAELRKNHFHMGLDFRTDNKENVPIFAVEKGYVSRILISPNGYGKAIYIHHPEVGFTSVYAHLNYFIAPIQNWIDSVQYSRETNTIDLAIPPNLFAIQKGQQIAWSGNTGSSYGPHLHFEIRNLYTEKTINPLWYFPQINDTKPPILSKIVLYHTSGESSYIQAFNTKDIQGQTISVSHPQIGIAVSAYDSMDNSPNVFGIYCLRIYEDDQLRYQLKMDSLDFSWQNHIQALSDYELPFRDIYKGFYEKCSFHLTDSAAINGIIDLTQKTNSRIKVEIYDFKGNMQSADFKLWYVPKANNSSTNHFENCVEEWVIDQEKFQVIIPKRGIAEDFVPLYSLMENLKSNELFKVELLAESTPILKPYRFTYKGKVHPALKNKIYLESIVDGKSKTYTGNWEGHFLSFSKIKNFGKLTLKYDMQKPIIAKIYTKTKESIAFIIEDKESGISSYKLFIDGKWRKLYYDEKNNQIIYTILQSDKNKKVKALIEVTDKVGNKTLQTMEIFM